MLAYGFMDDAFAASGMVAVVAGLVGYVLVLRRQAFAAHALSHVGFTGATGAALLGLPPLWGMTVATLLAGAGMGLLGERLAQRDVAIGMVLAVSLGLGLLFLHFFTSYASEATALLFGNVLGVDRSTLWSLAVICCVGLAGLGAILRPLLFATLQPELAQARGVPMRTVSLLFLCIVALVTAGAAQVVGVLLVFTLTVGPAAAAQSVTTRLWPGLALSACLSLAQAWGGLTLAFYTDWPASFWITALSVAAYAVGVAIRR